MTVKMTDRQQDILRRLSVRPHSQREMMAARGDLGSQILYACLTLHQQGLTRLDRPKEAEKITSGETVERIYRYHLTPEGLAAIGRMA